LLVTVIFLQEYYEPIYQIWCGSFADFKQSSRLVKASWIKNRLMITAKFKSQIIADEGVENIQKIEK